MRRDGSAAMRRKLMLLAILVFLTTALCAVVVNSILGNGLHWNYSISRYVGLETWSAVVFALGNVFVATIMLYYLYGLGEEYGMSKWFYWVVVVMLCGLWGLSACPIGYFDPVGTYYGASAISRIHEFCSRVMFCAMLLAVSMLFYGEKMDRKRRIGAVLFIIYGLICTWAYIVDARWFINLTLIFESLYILGFMVWCLWCGYMKRPRKEVKRR